jgi:hypothetical protein
VILKKNNYPCSLKFYTAPILEPEVLLSQKPQCDESDKHRQVRLQKHSVYKKARLANESTEERADRLTLMIALQKQRLALESKEERAERLLQ